MGAFAWRATAPGRSSCLDDEGWMVCEHPERPVQGGRWHIFGRCRSCTIAMTAAVARGDAPCEAIVRLVLEPAET